MPDQMMFDRRALMQAAGALGVAGTLHLPAWAAAPSGVQAIQAIVDAKVAAKAVPGAAVAWGTGVSPPTFVHGGTLEFDSSAKVDQDSIWRLASLTKPIAGMAVMLMIGEGKIKLDQPVADFIPAFGSMRVIPDPRSPDSRPAARPITMRHLVTHTSGMSASDGAIADAYRKLGLGRGPGGAPPAADAMPAPRTLEEWTDRIAQAPLASDPGAKWIYGSSLDVASRVIEIVSGMPFDIFLERRFFAPLGMRSTGFWIPAEAKGRLVTMYAQRDGALVAGDRGPTTRLLEKPAIPRASGGLASTARDYDRFLAMLINDGTLDGTTVIPADVVKLGMSNILPPGTDMSAYSSPTGHDGYGAGGMVTTGGRRPGTYGWGGITGTTAFVNPQTKMRLSTFTNIGTSDFGRQVMAAADMQVA